ncbi:hypothetical protein OROHE_024109 [Orobanche hederae]
MQMHPGPVYKEHNYKVGKQDYMFKDDFLFEKTNSAMHMEKTGHYNFPPKHHYKHSDQQQAYIHYSGSNMPVMKPGRYDSPPKQNYNNKKHGYGGYHGDNYSETIYEKEDKYYHVNSYDLYSGRNSGHNKHSSGGDRHLYMSGMDNHNHYGGDKGGGAYTEYEGYYSEERKNTPVVWDCKGIDD